MATATNRRDRRSRRFAWILGAFAVPVLFLFTANAMGPSTDVPASTSTTVAAYENEAPSTTTPSTTSTPTPGTDSTRQAGAPETTTTTAPLLAAAAPETTTTSVAAPTSTPPSTTVTSTTTPIPATTSTTTTAPPTSTTTKAPPTAVPPTTTTQPPAAEPAQVTVRLENNTGGGLAGGTVRAASGESVVTGTTDESGTAVLGLLPGSYELTMSLNGTSEGRRITVDENSEPVVFASGRLTVDFTGSATLAGNSLAEGLDLLPGTHEILLADGRIAPADSVRTRRPAASVSASVDAHEDVTKAAIYTTLHTSSGEPIAHAAVSATLSSSREWQPAGSTDGSGVAAFLLDAAAGAVRMQAPGGGESVLAHSSTDDSFYDFATSRASVQLLDSSESPLRGGRVSLLSNDRWSDVGTTDETGTASFETFPGEYALSMTYNGTTEQRAPVEVTGSPVIFQTGSFTVQFSGDVRWGSDSLAPYEGTEQVLPGSVNVALDAPGLPSVLTQIDVEAGVDATATGAYVVVLDANGDPVEGATTKLRIRGNPSLGSTNDSGVTAALLPGTISGRRAVQANINGTTSRVRQNIAANSIYEFTAFAATVEVLAADGTPLRGVEVLQRTSKWLPIGTTDDSGAVHLDVFAGTKRNYRVTHGGTTETQAHRFSEGDSTLTFRKILGTVGVSDSAGAGLAGVEVLVKAKKWEPIGSTDESGTVSFEVFPGTKRSHRVTLNGTTATKAHRFTAKAPSLAFQTVDAAVVLLDSRGNAHVGVPIQQKAGKWATIGTTDESGAVVFQAFPTTKRSYRVTIGGTTVSKAHKFTAANGTLAFETVSATVRVVTTDGDPLSDVPVEQKTKGWAYIGSTDAAGAVTFEVFPGKGRRYRAEVDGVTKERGKKFTKANGVLELRFRPPAEPVDEEDPDDA